MQILNYCSLGRWIGWLTSFWTLTTAVLTKKKAQGFHYDMQNTQSLPLQLTFLTIYIADNDSA